MAHPAPVATHKRGRFADRFRFVKPADLPQKATKGLTPKRGGWLIGVEIHTDGTRLGNHGGTGKSGVKQTAKVPPPHMNRVIER